MKRFKELLEKRWFALTFALCTAILFFLILSNIKTIFGGIGGFFDTISPIVGGLVLAYLLNPVVVFFEKHPFKGIKNTVTRHGLSVVITLVIFLGAIVLLIGVVLPSVLESVFLFVDNFNFYKHNFLAFWDGIHRWLEESGIMIQENPITSVDINTLVSTVFTQVVGGTSALLQRSIDVGGLIFKIVVGLIICVYFLAGKELLVKGAKKLQSSMLQEKTVESHNAFLSRCHSLIIRFVGCDLLDGLIVGGANAVFMLITGMNFVPLISVIVGVTNLVPTFGPVVGFVIGFVLLIFVNPIHAIIFAVFTLILQTVDGYVIKPKLFGDVLGVPPVWVLIAIIIGGAVLGVVGIIISVPISAICSFVYHEYLLPALRRRKDARAKALASKESEKKEE